MYCHYFETSNFYGSKANKSTKNTSFSVLFYGCGGRTRSLYCRMFFIGSAARFAVPGRNFAWQSRLVSCRPLHCARVAPPAPGGAPLAYPTSYARRSQTPVIAAKHDITSKKEHHPDGWCSFLVAEAGLDLIKVATSF